MITEAFLGLFAGLASFIASLFGDLEAPAWLSEGGGAVEQLVGLGQGLSPWVPWTLIFAVVGAILAGMVVGFLIKVVRIVASFLTAGGGSAA